VRSTSCSIEANYWQTYTKHHAASLRQQSYLFSNVAKTNTIINKRTTDIVKSNKVINTWLSTRKHQLGSSFHLHKYL